MSTPPEEPVLAPFVDTASHPPLSAPRTGPSPETGEQRERRCPFHKICTCSHTECRDGWLDEDVPNPSELNVHNVASRRCPRCDDARVMASELAGMKGRR